MITYLDIEKKLMKEITEEKGFSFKKLVKIVELNAILNNLEK